MAMIFDDELIAAANERHEKASEWARSPYADGDPSKLAAMIGGASDLEKAYARRMGDNLLAGASEFALPGNRMRQAFSVLVWHAIADERGKALECKKRVIESTSISYEGRGAYICGALRLLSALGFKHVPAKINVIDVLREGVPESDWALRA